MHKSGVIFHIFPRHFNQKLKKLRSTMTKIASRGSSSFLSSLSSSRTFHSKIMTYALGNPSSEMTLGYFSKVIFHSSISDSELNSLIILFNILEKISFIIVFFYFLLFYCSNILQTLRVAFLNQKSATCSCRSLLLFKPQTKHFFSKRFGPCLAFVNSIEKGQAWAETF